MEHAMNNKREMSVPPYETRKRQREATLAVGRRTDRDKLADAFRSLRKAGIVARMNFSCCGTCGHYELSENGKGRGYVFYHRQEGARLDGDSLPEGGLYLQWNGGMSVAADIVAALNAQRLHAVMPPNEHHCIEVRS
jgi:hypothetical protein